MTENYLVLARKYRPTNFADLKGQEFLVTTIINSIKLNRTAHTYLLTGIRGGGKTTTARIIAKTLNCENPIFEENLVLPCGKCSNCIAANSNKHPDIIELDAASRTGVNDVREIIENSNYLPLLGKYKIFIIDEVHMLSNNAFNALLKTLEEPPEHVKFIFATTELRKVPITILSRCQKFELKRLTLNQLVIHLKEILSKEIIEAEEEALKLIALHAEGSVRDSLSLLDLVISNANQNKITKSQVRALLGYTNDVRLSELLKFVSDGDAAKAIEVIKEFYYEGKDLANILQQLMGLIHSVTKFKLNIDENNLEYGHQELSTLADELKISTLTIIWQMLLKGLQELHGTFNQLLTFEMIIIRLCYLNDIPTPAELIEKINCDEPVKKNSKIEQKPSKIILENFEELVQLFQHNREMLLYQYLLNDVHLIEFEQHKIKIRHTKSVPYNFANKVAAFLQEWTGDKWNIIVSSEDEGSPTLHTQAENFKTQQMDEYNQHNVVKEVLKNFTSAKINNVLKR